jgi:hypothetical protein
VNLLELVVLTVSQIADSQFSAIRDLVPGLLAFVAVMLQVVDAGSRIIGVCMVAWALMQRQDGVRTTPARLIEVLSSSELDLPRRGKELELLRLISISLVRLVELISSVLDQR